MSTRDLLRDTTGTIRHQVLLFPPRVTQLGILPVTQRWSSHDIPITMATQGPLRPHRDIQTTAVAADDILTTSKSEFLVEA